MFLGKKKYVMKGNGAKNSYEAFLPPPPNHKIYKNIPCSWKILCRPVLLIEGFVCSIVFYFHIAKYILVLVLIGIDI